MNIDFLIPLSWLRCGFQKVCNKISLCSVSVTKRPFWEWIFRTITLTLYFSCTYGPDLSWFFKFNWERAELIFCVSWKHAWIAALWEIDGRRKLAAAVSEWNAMHCRTFKSVFYTKLPKLSSSWRSFRLFDPILKVRQDSRYQHRCFANFIFLQTAVAYQWMLRASFSKYC